MTKAFKSLLLTGMSTRVMTPEPAVRELINGVPVIPGDVLVCSGPGNISTDAYKVLRDNKLSPLVIR